MVSRKFPISLKAEFEQLTSDIRSNQYDGLLVQSI